MYMYIYIYKYRYCVFALFIFQFFWDSSEMLPSSKHKRGFNVHLPWPGYMVYPQMITAIYTQSPYFR